MDLTWLPEHVEAPGVKYVALYREDRVLLELQDGLLVHSVALLHHNVCYQNGSATIAYILHSIIPSLDIKKLWFLGAYYNPPPPPNRQENFPLPSPKRLRKVPRIFAELYGSFAGNFYRKIQYTQKYFGGTGNFCSRHFTVQRKNVYFGISDECIFYTVS